MPGVYDAMMSTQQLPEEEQRMLAEQLRGRAAGGGALSTSTIAPVAAQGARMQNQAQQQAQQVGLQQYRGQALEQRTKEANMKALAKLMEDEDKSPYNKITSMERKSGLKEMNTNNKEAMLIETWNPSMQMRAHGGLAQMSAKLGGPTTESMDKSITWWKQYSDWENRIRNDLFGSALTGYEITAWDKANVNPNMSAELVQQNFAIRETIIRKHAAEQAAMRLSFGWPKKDIMRMYKILPDSAFEDLDAYADTQETEVKSFFSEGSADDLSEEEILRQLEEL